MSQENVALTLRVMDAFNRRDLGTYLSLMDPEVELTPYEVWVQGGNPYRRASEDPVALPDNLVTLCRNCDHDAHRRQPPPAA